MDKIACAALEDAGKRRILMDNSFCWDTCAVMAAMVRNVDIGIPFISMMISPA